MGYYTYVTLSIKDTPDLEAEKILTELYEQEEEKENEKEVSYSDYTYALDEEGFSINSIKEPGRITKIIREFSKKYPDKVFQLFGDGEESDDFWIDYIKNGKAYGVQGRIVYDEYDESKLQD
jgi:hypothetical protein